jgi:tetratricopeptide (TPR) repeat protein
VNPLRALRGFSGRPWFPAIASAVLVLLGVAAYSRCLTVPFLFDDAPAIERNQSIRHLWPLREALSPPQTAAGATGRPVVNLTLALNYAVGGLDPRGYHLFNLVVHLLTGLALFGLIRRSLLLPLLCGRFGADSLPFALGTAAWWIVHPLLSESVVCVVQRNELLAGLFYLLTLYCFVRSVTSPAPGRWQLLAVGACVLGMASKEVMATAPLMVLLFDRTFAAGTFRDAFRWRSRFYAALACTWALLAVLVLQHQQRAGTVGFGLGVSSWTYLVTQCRALAIYLQLSFWPHPLVLDYGVDVARSLGDVWPEGLCIVMLLAGTVAALRWWPALGFLGAWFFVILAPSSSILPLTTQPIAEHRMYLPLAAVLVLVVTLVRVLAGWRGGALVAVLVLVSIWLTAERVHTYQDEATIWADTISKRPGNARAYASLGHALARQERWNEALMQYQEAIRLRPDYADAQSDCASMLLRVNRVEAALPHIEAALRLKPDDNDIQYNLAVALAQAGRTSEAIANLEAVLGRNPLYAPAWNNLGDALLKTGHRSEALAAFERAIQIEPGSAASHNNAGVALAALGRWQDAVGHYAAAVRLEPGNLEIHGNYGDALFQAGRLGQAADQYRAALRLNPRLAGLHYNLGNVWLQMGRLEEAVQAYEDALRLQPDFAAAHHNLGLALTRLGRPAAAVPHFEETLRQLPASADAHHNLAIALGKLGRIDAALAHDEEAFRLQPDFPAAREHYQQLRSGK